MRTPLPLVLAFLLVPLMAVEAQNTTTLDQGKTFFQQGRYTDALASFREAGSGSGSGRAEAQFWTGKTLLALGRSDQSNVVLSAYLQQHPTDRNREEARYLVARSLYLMANIQGSLEAFTSFVQDYPTSSYAANAYFWIGDCLLSLGKLEEAARFFQLVVNQYPNSFKAEAAGYKSSLITLKSREEDLLALLTWSHEENIKNIEDFQRREVAYQEAIRTYQTSLLRLAPDDFKSELAFFQGQIRALEASVREVNTQNTSLSEDLKASQTALVVATERIAALERDLKNATLSTDEREAQLEARSKLLDAKEEALRIKEAGLQRLETRGVPTE